NRYNYFLDKRVQILAKDARQYLKQVSKNYDVILCGLPSAPTLMHNRFYSTEFFKLCRSRLTPNGIYSFSLPYSESYTGPELTQLNKQIGKTFQAVFPKLLIWPGTANHFIGFANENTPLSYNSWSLVSRMNELGIRNSYFTPQAIVNLLTREKADKVQVLLAPNSLPINTDLRPHAYFYHQILWLSYLRSSLKYFYSKATPLITYGFFAFIFCLILYLKLAARNTLNIPTTIFSLGSGAMILQIANIFLFQVLVGSLYYQIGILILLFMLGLFLGSYQSNKEFLIAKILKKNLPLKAALLLIPAAALLTLTIGAFTLLPTVAYLLLFPLLSLLIGYPIGRIYGLGVQRQEKFTAQPGFLAALIYSADIWGGAFMALLTTTIVLPTVGFLGTICIAIGFIFLAMLKTK
ncbi:spermidine synthase, partial [Candidatus Margulisiibacteriota bacterium]